MAHYVTNRGKLLLSRGDWDDLAAGGFYLGLILAVGGVVPNGISTTASILIKNTVSDLLTSSGVVEASGGWYSRKALVRIPASEDDVNNNVHLDCDDVSWSTTTNGVQVAAAFIAKENGTDAQDELVSIIVFDSVQTLNGGPLTIQFNDIFVVTANALSDPPSSPPVVTTVNELFASGSTAADAHFTMLQNNLSISDGTLRVSAVNQQTDAYHNVDLGSINHYVEADVVLGASDTGSYFGINARQATAGYTYYNLQVQPGGILVLLKVVNGSLTQLGSYTTGWSPSSTHKIRLEVNGNSIIALTDGTQRISVTDSGITTGTRVGVYAYATVSTTNLQLDNFKAEVLTGSAPSNTSPVAAFVKSISNLIVTFNGSSSNDADGSIVSYLWNFGDSITATGPTATHTYASPGTYSVSLTVTDNQGATNTSTQSVTVASSGGGGGGSGTAFVAGYMECYRSDFNPSNANSNYRVLLHSFGIDNGAGTISIFSSGVSLATLKTQYQALKAAGRRVILSLGGSANSGASGLQTSQHRTNFLNSVTALVDEYGFQGIDFDFEAGVPISVDGFVYVARQLRALYGSDFWITMAPFEVSSVESAMKEVAKQLKSSGDLTYVGYQFYNLNGGVPNTAVVLAKLQEWMNYTGATPNEMVLGLWYGPWDWPGGTIMSYAQMITVWNGVKAQYPTIRGVYTWGIFGYDAPSWPFATQLGAVIYV